VPCVVPDSALGLRRVAEHLAGLGHESVTYVAGPEASWADGMRWSSLRDAAAALQLVVRRIGPFAPDIAGGVAAAEVLRASPTSAVIAYNDQLAIGLIRGLTAHGVRVPRDVSVIGFDNIPAADLVTPGLTTVAAPLRLEGAAAIRQVLAMIDGAPTRAGAPAVLPVKLVVRGSTAQRSLKSTSPASGTTKVSPSARNASMSTSAGSR
jgi:LacI family transcriptional regulator